MTGQLAEMEGITDLTTTEGKIRNFSRICKYVLKGVEHSQLIELIRNDPYCRRTNESVIDRHLKILEKLKIIKWQDTKYYLSDLGEVLYSIVKGIEDSREDLNLDEKIFYFKVMFCGVTFIQLSLLLKTISENKGKPKGEIMTEYFKFFLKIRAKLWERGSIEDCLRKYQRTGIFSRSYENRFDTMKMWLQNLGLVKNLDLTSIGKQILHEIDPEGQLPLNLDLLYIKTCSNVYKLTRLFLECPVVEFNSTSDDHWKSFLDVFKRGYTQFERPMKFSNIRAIKTWISIRLLVSHSIILEETIFDSLLYRMQEAGIIKSMMLGDDGKAAFVRLN